MSVTKQDLSLIRDKFVPLFGMKSWKVSLGVGSFITFEFGKPIVTDGDFKHGEWHLWVYDCAWRIETLQKVIAGSEDPREKLMNEVKHLENLPLLSVDIILPSLETHFGFDGGLYLKLFPIYSTYTDEHLLLFTPEEKVLALACGSWSYKRSDIAP